MLKYKRDEAVSESTSYKKSIKTYACRDLINQVPQQLQNSERVHAQVFRESENPLWVSIRKTATQRINANTFQEE